MVFRSPGGEASPRFSRSPPRARREVEIIATVFQDSAASEVTAEVTVGARSLVLHGQAEGPPRRP